MTEPIQYIPCYFCGRQVEPTNRVLGGNGAPAHDQCPDPIPGVLEDRIDTFRRRATLAERVCWALYRSIKVPNTDGPLESSFEEWVLEQRVIPAYQQAGEKESP